MRLLSCLSLLAIAGLATMATAQNAPKPGTHRGDALLADYFRGETAALEERSLADVKTLEEWNARREEYRRELAEMLGLWPMPERTDLKARESGGVDHPEFRVENVQFQSRPGLYVTGNLYLPKGTSGPSPAVLYVCGHANVKKNGVSYGSKAHYQHHGAWLARNGYVCLVIDTLQLGEIEGLHHGLYREGMWWWNNRGYTPAGVEAWNSIRALDYLQSRPEVDGKRLGVTGRSGGGAYSWWLAALDDRIGCAIPVAGITDLHNHVVDGTVEGHCDCMFMVNTYRWDYAQVAALVAPRPLLIANSDKDPIFPLEGVVRIHAKVRKIYDLHKAGSKLGLLITEGPHEDTQELQVPTLRWLNRHLKGVNPPVGNVAEKLFQPEPLKVFSRLPEDQQNTKIHESFVPEAAAPSVPESADAWRKRRDSLLAALKEKTFRGWPERAAPLQVKELFSAERQGVRLTAYDFISQENVLLRLYLARRAGLERADLLVLNVLDEPGWSSWLAALRPAFEAELARSLDGAPLPAPDEPEWASTKKMFETQKWAMAWVAPRGIGLTAWNPDPKKQTHIRRRFALLGQTRDAMRIWDVRRAIQAIRAIPGAGATPLWLQGEREMAGVALYASLFEPEIARLDLWHLPRTHREGLELLNVSRILEMPEAVALAAERSKVRLYQKEAGGWDYPVSTARKLGWGEQQIQVRRVGE